MKITLIKLCMMVVCCLELQGCTMVMRDTEYAALDSDDWQKQTQNLLGEGLGSTTAMFYKNMCINNEKSYINYNIGGLDNTWFGFFLLPIIPISAFSSDNYVHLHLNEVNGTQCPILKINKQSFKADKSFVYDDGTVSDSCGYKLWVPLKDFTLSFDGKVGQCQLSDIHYKMTKKETKVDWFWDFNG